MPTGGRIEWTWTGRSYMASVSDGLCKNQEETKPCPSQNVDWAGIASKTMYESDGSLSGKWEYFLDHTFDNMPAGNHIPEERRVVVRSPGVGGRSDDTIYYFRAFSGATSFYYDTYTPVSWDYGLPYTRRVQDTEGRFLSVEYFEGNAYDPQTATVSTSATKRRSDFVTYAKDADKPTIVEAPSFGDPNYQNVNRHLTSSSTVYEPQNGDIARSVSTTYSSFDGVGHFRQAVTTSNFGNGDNRTTLTNYNDLRGDPINTQVNEYSLSACTDCTWSKGTYVQWPVVQPWVLGAYDKVETTEAGRTQTTLVSFEKNSDGYTTTGFLRARRVLLGSSAASNDLLSVYTRDASGNTISEQYFGGDLADAPLTGYELDATQRVSGEQFRIDHDYPSVFGSSWIPYLRSRYVDSAGNSLGFYVKDVTIDQNTGLAVSSRDATGIQTDFAYDGMGRVTQVKPQSGAWSAYEYSPFTSASSPARVKASTYPNGSASGTAYTQHKYEYDGFGRLVKTAQLLPPSSCNPPSSECWSKQITAYNAMGWKDWVSEVGADTTPDASLPRTTYANYDPFGRVGLITAPDGKTTTFTYTGVRETSRKVNIATGYENNEVQETAFTTTETYDGFGRLISVKEPSGAQNALSTTKYKYDHLDRLIEVCQNPDVDNVCGQTRIFTYDNRGFLLSESIPEKTGLVSYTSYDAKGHLLEKNDNGTVLGFSYDRAERLLSVSDASGIVKTYTYDNANTTDHGKSAGKLIQAWRKNGETGAQTKITEDMEYNGVAGMLSKRKTSISHTTSSLTFENAFEQSFNYNDLGGLASETYAQPTGELPEGVVLPDRTISYEYTHGVLTGVPGFASQLSYYPNGMVAGVQHANGVTDQITLDSYGMARPKIIGTSGAKNSTGGVADWTTGEYKYDGVGNIWAMGSDIFTYDGVSRLTSSTLSVPGSTILKKQGYSYDTFGNMTTMSTCHNWLGDTNCLESRAYGVDAASNQMSVNDAGKWYATYLNDGSVTSLFDDTHAKLSSHTWTPLGDMRTTVTTSSNRTYTYAYDVDGERVMVEDSALLGGVQSGIMITLRGIDNKPRRELRVWHDASGNHVNWEKDYIYRGGQLLASVSSNPSAIVSHYHLDHLGTTRLITDAGGTVKSELKLFPFGEELAADDGLIEGPDGKRRQFAERLRFTGHERDLGDRANLTDDIDYMHARYYKPILGRFVSTDLAPGKKSAPQSWNRYSYAFGNPLIFIDLTGLANVVFIVAISPGARNTLGEVDLPSTTYYGAKDWTDNAIGFDSPLERIDWLATGEKATPEAFRKSVHMMYDITAFLGHSADADTDSPDLRFSTAGNRRDDLSNIKNNNALVILASCSSDKYAGRLGVSDKTKGQALVGFKGNDVKLGHMFSIVSVLINRLSTGMTLEKAVEQTKKEYKGIGANQLVLIGDGSIRFQR